MLESPKLLYSHICCALQTQVGSSPTYHVDKRLGKGGFGQVFLGKRVVVRRNSRDTKPHQVSEAPNLAVSATGMHACHNVF